MSGTYGNGPAWTPDHLFPIEYPEDYTGALPEPSDYGEQSGQYAPYEVQEVADPAMLVTTAYQEYYSENALPFDEGYDPVIPHHDPGLVQQDFEHFQEEYMDRARIDQQVYPTSEALRLLLLSLYARAFILISKKQILFCD
jgi:hypothetical protein